MSNIPTPHIECANKDLIAKTVLMPGDPQRAKFVADNFLENVVMFNSVRGNLGYTGYYKGHKVSVLSSGMGMPSISIYAYELYNFYDVENIIRIGSCGSYVDELKLFDVILVDKAYTDSNFSECYCNEKTNFSYPSKELNEKLKESAKHINENVVLKTIHSSDVFYHLTEDYQEEVLKNGAVAVEMEAFALFKIAEVLNKNASALLTVSDSFTSHAKMDSKDRETKFNTMILIALNSLD